MTPEEVFKRLKINVYSEPKLKLDETPSTKLQTQLPDNFLTRDGFLNDVVRGVGTNSLNYLNVGEAAINAFAGKDITNQKSTIEVLRKLDEAQKASDARTLSPEAQQRQAELEANLQDAQGAWNNIKAGGAMAYDMLRHPIDNAGKIVAGAIDPLNLFPLATGAKVAKALGGGTIAKTLAAGAAGAASNAPVSAIQEGAFAAAKGEDWQKAALAGAGGGAVGGAMLGSAAPLVGGAWAKYKKATTPIQPIVPDVIDATPQALLPHYGEVVDAHTINQLPFKDYIDAEIVNTTENKLIGHIQNWEDSAKAEDGIVKNQISQFAQSGMSADAIKNTLDNLITPSPNDLLVTHILNDNTNVASRFAGLRLLPLLENSIEIAKNNPDIARTNKSFYDVLKKGGLSDELATKMVQSYATKDSDIFRQYVFDKLSAHSDKFVNPDEVKQDIVSKYPDFEIVGGVITHKLANEHKTYFNVDDWVRNAGGINDNPIFAYLSTLSHKHPEMFKNEADVFRVIKSVKDDPTYFTNGSNSQNALISKMLDNSRVGKIAIEKNGSSENNIPHATINRARELDRIVKRQSEGSPLPSSINSMADGASDAHSTAKTIIQEKDSNVNNIDTILKQYQNNITQHPQELSNGRLKLIGENQHLEPIYEDVNGVRATYHDGHLSTEPVPISPSGYEVPTINSRLRRGKENYITVEEAYKNNIDTILKQYQNNIKREDNADNGLGRTKNEHTDTSRQDRQDTAREHTQADKQSGVESLPTGDNAKPASRGERGTSTDIQDVRHPTVRNSKNESLGGKSDERTAQKELGGQQDNNTNDELMGGRNSADEVVRTKADNANDAAKQDIHERTPKSNYDLTTKEPIKLTQGQRKKINEQALEILKKPDDELSLDDLEILRQYTGEGGLDNAKGEGIFNQHYTSYPVIKAMYQALNDAGFSFKTALEPAVGSGNFVGHAPRAKWDLVDIDKTNTEIAKRLYPEANYIHSGSFETFKGKDYDLIISNVPFASYESLPRDYAHKIQPNFKAIHNFYFAHALDKIKDDGVIAFITSTGTMDGKNEAGKLRELLTSKADLIGAFRLPMKTFASNAHTDTMADIIFLQKRPDGASARDDIREANEQFTNIINKDGYPINEYFANNPQKILGELIIDKDKTKMGKMGWVVKGEPRLEDLKVDYKAYIQNEKPQKTVNNSEQTPSVFKDFDELYKYTSENELEIYNKKGLYFSNNGGVYTPILANKKVTFEMTEGHSYIGEPLRDYVGERLGFLEAIKQNIDKFQQTNEKRYSELATKYAKEYIEHYKDDALKSDIKTFLDKNGATGKWLDYKHMFDGDKLAKSATEQVRFSGSGKVEANENSPIEIKAAYNEDSDGKIDITKAKLLSLNELQSLVDNHNYAYVDEHIIQNPAIYYTGHLYSKIQKANTLKGKIQDSILNKQIDELRKNYPPAKTIDEIRFTGNEKFMNDERIYKALGISKTSSGFKFNSNYLNSHNAHLYEKLLNEESLVKKDEKESGEEYLARLKAANKTIQDIILPEVHARAAKSDAKEIIEQRFNDYLNSYKEPKFDGSTLKNLPTHFRGKPLELLRHQSEGIERIMFNKKGVVAFAPGGGKTITAIIAVKQLMDRGAIKKPLYVVPANTIPQWKNSIKELYPQTNIKQFAINKAGKHKGKEKQWSALSATEKHESLYDIAHSNYEATVVSYEMFNDILLPQDVFERYIDEFSRDALNDIEDESGKKVSQKEIVKREKAIRLLKQKFKETREAKSHLAITLDQLGFDAIIVDEAHNFKNIGFKGKIVDSGLGTNIGIKLIEDEKGNAIDAVLQGWQTYDMRFKARYIAENNNRNNNILLTGTPTPNKPMELYTILNHLDTEILKEYGIDDAADFAKTFFEFEKQEMAKQDGSVSAKNTYTAIKQLSTLDAIKDRFINYLDYDQMPDLVRPEAEYIDHLILQGDTEAQIASDILHRLAKAQQAAKERMRGSKTDAEGIGAVYFSGKDASVDRRFYLSKSTQKHTQLSGDIKEQIMQKETDPKYSKIAKTVELVVAQRAANDRAGQIIFIDRQTVGDTNIHQEIKQDLINSGKFTNEQVGIANGTQVTDPKTGKEGTKSDANRQTLVDAFNNGIVKVIIGTTDSLGVGVDLQKHTTDIYNIDIPWTADELSQRINRGVRQGNENSKVRVHNFFQMGSYDRLVLSIVQKKIGFNDIFWRRQDKSANHALMPSYSPPDYYDLAIEIEPNPIKKQSLIVQRDYDKLQKQIKEVAELADAERVKMVAKRGFAEQVLPDEIETLKRKLQNIELPKYENIKDTKEREAKLLEFEQKEKESISGRIKKREIEIENAKAELEELQTNYNSRIEKKAELEQELGVMREAYFEKDNRGNYNIDYEKIGNRFADLMPKDC